MKKIYQTPNIKVVVLKPMQIICTSQLGISGRGTSEGGVTVSDSRRARFSDWDFEEEE